MHRLEPIKLKGEFTAKQYDAFGNLKDWEKIYNTVSDGGKADVAELIRGTGNSFGWLAVGDSGTALASGDNTLNSEITNVTDLNRASATTSASTNNVTDDTSRFVHTFTNSSSNQITVQETGIFNTSSANTSQMLAGQTFSDKNLDNNDTLKITYDITVS